MNFQELADEIKAFEGLYYHRVITSPKEITFEISSGEKYNLTLMEEREDLFFCSYNSMHGYTYYLAFAGPYIMRYTLNEDITIGRRKKGTIYGQDEPERTWRKKVRDTVSIFEEFLKNHPSTRLRQLF